MESGAFLFHALVLMTRHHIERVVVFRDQEVQGIVDLTDILSHFSTHSHVIALRIERSASTDQLKEASRGLPTLVRALVSHGVKMPFIMDLMAALNGRIMRKLFEMVMPAELVAHSCLMVMGSEGRGEQILKTDQDNALVVADDVDPATLSSPLAQFSSLLVDMGFPSCPGNIMVSNPQWVMTQSQWRKHLNTWITSGEAQHFMQLAIFSDAQGLAGHRILFKQLKEEFLAHLKNNELFFHHFVKPALNFQSPFTLFGGLKSDIDLKKTGIFPIVHGVRTLALRHQVWETNTLERLQQLALKGVLSDPQASSLKHAFITLVRMNLGHKLRHAEQDTSLVHTERIQRMDRDLLRDSLRIVKDFRLFLSQTFHQNFG
jgi:CBS domain-containing protein